MPKLIKKPQRFLWWVMMRKTVRWRQPLYSNKAPSAAPYGIPKETNLPPLFIFMNSCHLAQCEMMGHSRATRRATAEFTIARPASVPSLPVSVSQSLLFLLLLLFSPYCTCLDDLLNMDAGGGERVAWQTPGEVGVGRKRFSDCAGFCHQFLT